MLHLSGQMLEAVRASIFGRINSTWSKVVLWLLIYGAAVQAEHLMYGKSSQSWWLTKGCVGVGFAILYVIIAPKLNRIEEEYRAREDASSGNAKKQDRNNLKGTKRRK